MKSKASFRGEKWGGKLLVYFFVCLVFFWDSVLIEKPSLARLFHWLFVYMLGNQVSFSCKVTMMLLGLFGYNFHRKQT